MRHVLKNHNEVAHYWAHKTQEDGRATNMFFEGDTIYSYGHHFAIARHASDSVILFTTREYSVSTRTHINLVRRAIGYDNPQLIYCQDVRANNPAQHTNNLRAMLAYINELRGKMQRARKNKPWYAGRIVDATANHNRYVATFGIGAQLSDSETMTRHEFKTELAALIKDLIPTIADDYRASDDREDDTPGMQITIGADGEGWSYQTGDNSYTGGAYAYAHWGVGSIYRDSDPAAVAEDLISDLENQGDETTRFFFDEPQAEG